MPEENGHRTPYEKMVDLKDFVNAGTKRGSPDHFNVTDGDPRCILAMARSNDPLYCGQPAQREAGEWFAKFHKTVGGRKAHIRFLFYVAVGQYKNPLTDEHEPFPLPDGTLLDKESEEDWVWFQDAAKWARNMKLVEPRLIIDKRKYQLHEHVARWEPDEPSFDISAPTILLPTGGTGIARRTYVLKALGTVHGYDPDEARTPSTIEVWVEKDLDEADQPVMETVCRQLGVNLVTGTGFMTISAVYAMLDRHPNLEKPIRIIYLSDFDASGEHMPIGPARHIESAIEDMDPRPDIRLYRLALTAEQVQEKSLPKKLGGAKKDKEKKVSGRKIRFEARHGEGSVELNAVTDEANVPWFEELLRTAILALRDGEIDRKLRETKREAKALVDREVASKLYWPHRALDLDQVEAEEVVEGVIAPQADEREALKKREEELRYLLSLLEQRQSELDEEVDEKIAPLEERGERVQLHARARIDRLKDELEPPAVEPEEPAGAAENWLFDSRRGYFTQRSYYLGYKGNDGSGRSPEELDRLVAVRKQEREEGE